MSQWSRQLVKPDGVSVVRSLENPLVILRLLVSHKFKPDERPQDHLMFPWERNYPHCYFQGQAKQQLFDIPKNINTVKPVLVITFKMQPPAFKEQQFGITTIKQPLVFIIIIILFHDHFQKAVACL